MPRSNDDLIAFLTDCTPAECFTILASLKSTLCPDSGQLCDKYPTLDSIPPSTNLARRALATDMVNLLRWYGSNSIAYALRMAVADHPGVDYTEVVRDAAQLLNAQLPRSQRIPIPRLADALDYEQLVVQLVLGLSLRDKSAEEIAALLEESGLAKEAAVKTAKSILLAGAPGIAVGTLVKLLGKTVVHTIMENLLVTLISQVLSKQAAEMLARKLLIQLTQRALAFWLTAIAILWAILDMTTLASGPATRITLPTVTLIATLRLRRELETDRD
jgi:hypothetical protein